MVVPVGSVTHKGAKTVYQVRTMLEPTVQPRPAGGSRDAGLRRTMILLLCADRNGRLTHLLQGGKVGKVAQELYSALTDLQSERLPDPNGWLLPVEC